MSAQEYHGMTQNNQDGIRPIDTLVQLYADGTALGDKAVIESNKEWTKTWSNLPKYKAGKENCL